jgi:hypothetical protein
VLVIVITLDLINLKPSIDTLHSFQRDHFIRVRYTLQISIEGFVIHFFSILIKKFRLKTSVYMIM